MTRVTRHPSPGAFLAAAGPYLLAREVEHVALLGTLGELAVSGGEGTTFATAHEAGSVAGAAVRRPGRSVALARCAHPEAAAALAQDLAREGATGVAGPEADVVAFAGAWSAATGTTSHRWFDQWLHVADAVAAPGGVSGALRPAGDGDRELLTRWFPAMMADAGDLPQDVDVAAVLRTPGVRPFLWEDGGRPRSMAWLRGPTARGVRLSHVYTPPADRRRGYAAACTAAVTALALAEGRDWCALFTDRANPTSNGVYRRIGYRVVADVALEALGISSS